MCSKIKIGCQHKEKEIIQMPIGYIHYAKTVCAKCKKFMYWEQNPNITSEIEKRNNRIDRILEEERLNSFEEQFLETIRKKRFLTPKQQDCYDNIVMKFQ